MASLPDSTPKQTKQIDCTVYRCAKQPEMYIYVPEDTDLDDLPEAVKKRTGHLTPALNVTLTPERKLAREKAETVMENIQSHGFHIQMPPNPLKVDLYAGD